MQSSVQCEFERDVQSPTQDVASNVQVLQPSQSVKLLTHMDDLDPSLLNSLGLAFLNCATSKADAQSL